MYQLDKMLYQTPTLKLSITFSGKKVVHKQQKYLIVTPIEYISRYAQNIKLN